MRPLGQQLGHPPHFAPPAAPTPQGWRPEKLHQGRSAHRMTLYQAGDRLRLAARQTALHLPAADSRTLTRHETGEEYPGPHYRRAYCLVYDANAAELGFRLALPDEDAPVREPHPTRVAAVDAALRHILPETPATAADPVHARLLAAWRHRHARNDRRRPAVVIVGGYAGSGKSELSRFLSWLTGWPVLDKDPLTRALVEGALAALGASAQDRDSDLYRSVVRPVEYDALMRSVGDRLRAHSSAIVTAPFTEELTDAAWMSVLAESCAAQGTDLYPVWVRCDAETMREHMQLRGAGRDAWKLSRWDEYVSTIDPDARPATAHTVVDNRLGRAVAHADLARYAIAQPDGRAAPA